MFAEFQLSKYLLGTCFGDWTGRSGISDRAPRLSHADRDGNRNRNRDMHPKAVAPEIAKFAWYD